MASQVTPAPDGRATTRWLGVGSRQAPWLTAIALLATALIIRAPQFGNPLIHVDEGFYLLVGDRMLQGALPYVDIWDRKPIGLFLIYAAARLPGGDGIIAYQIAATLCAAATAVTIAAIVRRMGDRIAALTAGAMYLFMINIAGGIGGQSPVFYNALVAGAVWLTLRATQDSAMTAAALRHRALVPMLLLGVAMQIKYSVAFEGAFVGLAWLWTARRRGASRGALAVSALMWMAVAIAPTALAWLAYALIGHGDAFVYANFLSILERGHEPARVLLARLGDTAKLIALPVMCLAAAIVLKPWRNRPDGAATFAFCLAWLAAAGAGYLAFGSYFDHYVLPLLVPLSVCAGPLFAYRRRHIGRAAAAAILLIGGISAVVAGQRVLAWRGGAPVMERMVQATGDRAGRGCIYIYRGDPILYHLTRSCLPSRYAFPTHLTLVREAPALGVDPAAEVRRILAARPEVIVDTRYDLDFGDNSAAIDRAVLARLARDYHPVATIRVRLATIRLYRLNGTGGPRPRDHPPKARSIT